MDWAPLTPPPIPYRCVEDGLLPTLSYRNLARLYATMRLVDLSLCPSSPEKGVPRLQAVCTENKTEENLNNLADDLDCKDFELSTGQEWDRPLYSYTDLVLLTPLRALSACPTGRGYLYS